MVYIENVFVCIAAPLLLAIFCIGGKDTRFLLHYLAGMGACLLSAYINTFLTVFYKADVFNATVEIAPVVEESLKLLPVLFYFLVFEPKISEVKRAVITVAAGFATFENICYLIQNGTERLGFLLLRGFGTGAMHVICGMIVGNGLKYVWQRSWLKAAGTFGLLGAAITFHAIYNLLIAYGGSLRYVAYALPLATMLAGMQVGKVFRAFPQRKTER